mmetsp:Transcript_23523/g.36798  ORF Transcript_23523/g.36798 Transcript_23523/m.36798 type:complete len:116 (-) Transcript_23523:12-359(-)
MSEVDAPSQLGSHAEGTPSVIVNSPIPTIQCSGCKNRVGLPAMKVDFVRCTFCSEVTNVAEVQQREKINPARMHQTDMVAKCARCEKFLAVPKQVISFQCGACGQVNVAGAIRPF